MEELFRKYKVRIREFEIKAEKAKVICRDGLPKEELLEKISGFKVVLYLYPNFLLYKISQSIPLKSFFWVT